MVCPRCGAPIPAGANFCMRCGTPVAQVEARPTFAQPGAIMVPGPRPARKVWPILGMLLAIGLVLFVGLSASGALQQRGENGPPTLQTRGKTAPPVLQDIEEPPPEMPQEVKDWLNHLRRIEERKNRLNATQVANLKVFMAKFEALGPAAGLLNDSGTDEDLTNPELPVKEKIEDSQAPWRQLIRDFQAVEPPEECKDLADEYYAGLNEVPAAMNDLNDIVKSISGPDGATTDAAEKALQKLYSVQNTSFGTIDEHFAASDEMLSQICEKYSVRKWFNIATDLGGGSLGAAKF